MRRIGIITMALILIPAVAAAASLKNSGNRDLNRYLEGISREVARGRLSRAALTRHLSSAFGVGSADVARMKRAGLEPGEMYLVGLIHKATTAPVNKILARKRREGDWEAVSYFLGSTPDTLNRMRLADEKSWDRTTPAVAQPSRSAPHPARKPLIGSKPPPAPKTKMMTMTSDGTEWQCNCRSR